MSKIRVLLADDHAVLRAGLRLLLEAQPDLTVVGEAETADQAVALDAQLQPDVVLMDLTLPARPGDADAGPAGLEAIQRIRASRPEARVLVLTMHDDEGYLRAVLQAGGVGYVLKRAADTELLSAIRAVYQGGTYLHPAHTKALLEGMLHRGENVSEPDSYQRLSPREQEVLKLLARGYTNQQVADQLYLSVKTVETYKARLMEKLGLRSRADIVRYALQRELLGEG
ncbi:MAG: response regulator transcription factor [Chloroflexi bacterium]|nr:response regulator transcription factor [Chloroflexota bacterium]